jgi:RNA polymerase primary sigma factor
VLHRQRATRLADREALAEWRSHGRRGVVEAVTGTGKTTVGVLAAAAAVDAGEKVLVLVPGRELLDQWYETL